LSKRKAALESNHQSEISPEAQFNTYSSNVMQSLGVLALHQYACFLRYCGYRSSTFAWSLLRSFVGISRRAGRGASVFSTHTLTTDERVYVDCSAIIMIINSKRLTMPDWFSTLHKYYYRFRKWRHKPKTESSPLPGIVRGGSISVDHAAVNFENKLTRYSGQRERCHADESTLTSTTRFSK